MSDSPFPSTRAPWQILCSLPRSWRGANLGRFLHAALLVLSLALAGRTASAAEPAAADAKESADQGAEQTEREQILAKLRELKVRFWESSPGKLFVRIDQPDANDAALALLGRLSGITELVMPYGSSEEIDFDHFARMIDLKSLSLYGFHLPESNFEKLGNLPQLETLYIGNFENFSDDTLKQLAKCRGIKRLYLSTADGQVSPAGFAHLASLASLDSLGVSGPGVTDKCIKPLVEIKSLRSLGINSPMFTNEGLRSIAEMKELERLGLTSETISADGIRHLRAMPKLIGLYLTKCPIGDGSLGAVGDLTNLHELYLNEMPITDAGLIHLSELVKLFHLQLVDCRITGDGLVYLRKLKNLHELQLEGERVSNLALAHLHLFPLDWLQIGAGRKIDKPGITDEGIKLLLDMPQLQRINFRGTALTDDGAQPLMDLPHLHTVSFQWCARSDGEWHLKFPRPKPANNRS